MAAILKIRYDLITLPSFVWLVRNLAKIKWHLFFRTQCRFWNWV